MTLRANNELVLAGVEDVYGVAQTLTGAAHAVQCDIEITPMEATPKERAYTRPYFGGRPVILTEVHRSIKMSSIELAGSGSPAAAPAWTSLLRGCGFSVVTTPTETTFKPVTPGTDSLTINPSIDGEQFRLTGARGTSSFVFEIGEFPMLEATYKGKWVDPTTLVTVPTPDYSGWKIPLPISCNNTAAMTINSVAYPFYSLRIDQNNDVQFYCVPGEGGQRIEIVGRQFKGTAKLQAKTITEHNIFQLARSNALVPVWMNHGIGDGNKVAVNGPKVQLLNPRASEYKGDLAWEVDLLFVPNVGNDEITIITS